MLIGKHKDKNYAFSNKNIGKYDSILFFCKYLH